MSKLSITTPPLNPPSLEAPILSLSGIVKAFDGNRVLHGVDLDVRPGQVLALVGENGAGKSTLMKIAAGVHQCDAGSMRMEGQPYAPRNPADALNAGIAMVHQELSLAPDLTVAENVFVGREPCRMGFVNWKELYQLTSDWLMEFCLEIDPATPISALGIGYRQVIEVLKALVSRPRIVIFDEPTSALEAQETTVVLDAIRRLAQRKIGVVYISHRMDEIFAVADSVCVLRDGRHVFTKPIGELNREAVVNAMVGREMEELYPPRGTPWRGELLRVEKLTRGGAFHDVSFDLRPGEVLGFSGLVGAGRTELMRAIFGADPLDAGTIFVEGRPVRFKSVREAMAAGIAYLPEERKTLGLFLARSVEDNIVSASLDSCAHSGLMSSALTRELSWDYCRKLSIKLVDITQEVGSLSGGNQQKVLLARWMSTQPKVLIVDEPTRGVDVGAKGEIHKMLRDYANAGNGVIVVSSEMPELLGLCDRIAVMREGRLAGEVAGAVATESALINLAVGCGHGEAPAH